MSQSCTQNTLLSQNASISVTRTHAHTHTNTYVHILPYIYRVQAPVLITRLVDGPQQHVIVMSFDGCVESASGVCGNATTTR
jgi:hypothetical protein